MSCTKESLTAVINRYGGLSAGSHDAKSGKCCLLEAVSVCEGREWTDSPLVLDRPDVRSLNDAAWSDDATRTEQMLRLAPLLEAWPAWSASKRAAWAQGVALRTVREILPIALRAAKLDEALVLACEQAKDLDAARVASNAASNAALYARGAALYVSNAAKAAKNASHAASRAALYVSNAALYVSDAANYANAARAAAGVTVLTLAITIWAEEAEKVA